MEYRNFAEAMRCLVNEHGKDKLLNDKARAHVLDYKQQFDTEANIFIKLLEADCAKIINEADNVLERKRQLVQRMEDKHGLSPKHTMPLLDLLGFLLRNDTTKCNPQPGDKEYELGNAANTSGNYTEAIKWYHEAAQIGHTEAQFILGLLYDEIQDYTKAAEWYHKAAEQENVQAQNNLGLLYANGQGVTQDYAKALEWWNKAAEQGDAQAQNNLGVSYAKGQGVKPDPAKAIELWHKAAEQGNKKAQASLDYIAKINEEQINTTPAKSRTHFY